MTFPFLCCSTATPRRPSPCWTDSTSTPTSPTRRSSPRGSATRRTSTPVRGYLTEFITEYKWFFIKFFQNFQAELAGGWKWNLKFGVPLMNPTHLLMQRFISPIHLLPHLNSIIDNSVVSRRERYCCTTFLYKRITKDFITTRKYFNMIHMKLHHLHIPTLH